jgi:uncharacterized lipoprotein YehR (DUF1307 family)
MRTSIAVTAAVLVLSLSACGDSEPESAATPSDAENPTTVTVSVVP